MSNEILHDAGAAGHGNAHTHTITIEVDGNERLIEQDKYLVRALKAMFGIPPEYELDRVVDGKFIPVQDTDTIEVHPKEQFVSHVRHGGSS